jgi:peroxin-6
MDLQVLNCLILGTGKTLVAKAVATTLGLNFFSVKGPELLNMYIGESERNVRMIFQKAKDASPCIIFFDELDSVAPARGKNSDSSNVMDRIVSQLLAELDDISSEVFVIGATNRPDLLDSSLLRPGRFEKMLYLGVASSNQEQLLLLKALTRKFNLDPNVDLELLISEMEFKFTGADFYALCADALSKSISKTILSIEMGESDISQDIVVKQNDFIDALMDLTPSVSEEELARYESIRNTFETR